MKRKKSLLAVCLFIIALVAFCTDVRAEPPQDIIDTEMSIDIDYPIAQNLAHEIEPVESKLQIAQAAPAPAPIPIQSQAIQSYSQLPMPIPIGAMEQNAFRQYGLVGFVVFVSLSLVVWVVKQDRATMAEDRKITRDLINSIQEQAKATEHHAQATRDLAEQVENKMELFVSKIESLEKIVIGMRGDSDS